MDKMKKIALFLVTIIGCLCSCNSNPNGRIISPTTTNYEVINLDKVIDNEYCYESEYIESVKIILLETTDQSLVHSPIHKVIYTKDRIFLWDALEWGGLICFDKNGKFINRAKKGQGPGEINHIVDISYDSVSDRIIVVDNPNVKMYDHNLDFVESHTLKYGVSGVTPISNGYLMHRYANYQRDYNDNDNYLVEVTDKNFKPLGFMLKNIINVPRLNSAINVGWDTIMISIPGSDTIYQYSNDVLSRKYVLKYKNKKEINTNYENNTGIEYTGSYFETTTHQLFQLFDSKYVYIAFRDKRNGVIKGSKTIRWNNNESIGTYTVKDTYCDTVVTYMWPLGYPKGSLKSNKYVSNADIKNLESLEKEDNPFIILYTLKEFDDEI